MKRIISILLVAILLLSFMPVFSLTASAETKNYYYTYDATKKEYVKTDFPETVVYLASTTEADVILEEDACCVVEGTVTIDGSICIENYADICLVLMDDAHLTVTGTICTQGAMSSIQICAQSLEETSIGRLTVEGNAVDAAGIGSGNKQFGGIIEINGGVLNVNGGEKSAAIGSSPSSSVRKITINGGDITAHGVDGTAAIGSGYFAECQNLTINNGTIKAFGGAGAAAIGASVAGDCFSLSIDGGNIIAIGGTGGVGIGSGEEATCEKILISGGILQAVGGKAKGEGGNLPAIGAAADGECAKPSLASKMVKRQGTNEEGLNFFNVFEAIMDSKKPTCTEAGYKLYFYDPIDNLYYADQYVTLIGDGSAEALEQCMSPGGDGYIAALGHDWAYLNESYHKCTRCEITEEHMDDNNDFICDECPYEFFGEALMFYRNQLDQLSTAGLSEDIVSMISAAKDALRTGEDVAEVKEIYRDQVDAIAHAIAEENKQKNLEAAKNAVIAVINGLVPDDTQIDMDLLKETYVGKVDEAKTIDEVMSVLAEAKEEIAKQYVIDLQNLKETIPATFTQVKVLLGNYEVINSYLDGSQSKLNDIDSIEKLYAATYDVLERASLMKELILKKEDYTTTEAKETIDLAVDYVTKATAKELETIYDDCIKAADNCELQVAFSEAIEKLETAAGENPSKAIQDIVDTYRELILKEKDISQIRALEAVAEELIAKEKAAEEAALMEAREKALEEMDALYGDTISIEMVDLLETYALEISEAKTLDELESIKTEAFGILDEMYKEMMVEIRGLIQENYIERALSETDNEQIVSFVNAYALGIENLKTITESEEYLMLFMARYNAMMVLAENTKNYTNEEALEIIRIGMEELSEADDYMVDMILENCFEEAHAIELAAVKEAALDALEKAADVENPSDILKKVYENNVALIEDCDDIDMIGAILEKALDTMKALTEEEPDDVELGDVNNDGNIDLKDVLVLRRFAAGQPQEGFVEKAADVNEDEVVDMKDILMLRKFIAKAIDKLGA